MLKYEQLSAYESLSGRLSLNGHLSKHACILHKNVTRVSFDTILPPSQQDGYRMATMRSQVKYISHRDDVGEKRPNKKRGKRKVETERERKKERDKKKKTRTQKSLSRGGTMV